MWRFVRWARQHTAEGRLDVVNHPLNTHSCVLCLSIHTHTQVCQTPMEVRIVYVIQNAHSQYSRLHWTMNCTEDLFRKCLSMSTTRTKQPLLRNNYYAVFATREQLYYSSKTISLSDHIPPNQLQIKNCYDIFYCNRLYCSFFAWMHYI